MPETVAFNSATSATTSADNIQSLHQTIDEVNKVLLGKSIQVKLAMSCILARGHLLIEDLPGMGKTTLAHTLAKVLGLEFSRIQFTSDLLPADILGSAVFNREESRFDFHPGPIFNQLLLADEVNRATPKTQSALLEAMAEQQVTVEGKTRPLPEPFFVIATQNPSYQIGTYPLPESQLDRFFMRLELGYPEPSIEKNLLEGRDRNLMINDIKNCMSSVQLIELQRAVDEVKVSSLLRDYIVALLTESRESTRCGHGLSPRAGLALQRAARAWALLDDRNYCLPEDVQAVFHAVVEHRLGSTDIHEVTPAMACEQLLDAVPVPV
ncbi:MAG: AAA family ATPase [Gammaproteobacteria bacterium]|nr:MAG: AAA family ATPase [Gammaproteobacteria bacterium]